MGAWIFVEPYLEWVLNQIGAKATRPRYAGRPASAATATGLMSKHLAQLKAFLDEALAHRSVVPRTRGIHAAFTIDWHGSPDRRDEERT